jgi:hypothetical protein
MAKTKQQKQQEALERNLKNFQSKRGEFLLSIKSQFVVNSDSAENAAKKNERLQSALNIFNNYLMEIQYGSLGFHVGDFGNGNFFVEDWGNINEMKKLCNDIENFRKMIVGR